MTTTDLADALTDVIAGHRIGYGFYVTTVGSSEAREIVADILPLIADAEKRAAAAALEDFAALIDRGPTFPLSPSIFSAMARERAADLESR